MPILAVPSSFLLSAAAAFYRGFTPMMGAASPGADTLSLAFLLDRTFTPVAVRLSQDGERLAMEVQGSADHEAVARQVRRMLGLDADAVAWAALGEREPVVGALQREFPGFFTATFPSPYEAAVGGIVAQRTSMAQAAAVRRRLAETHGTAFGDLLAPPTPRALLEVLDVKGLPASKVPWLHGVAEAALEGRLDAERLRALPQREAMEELRRIPGLGPWTAEHVLLRGAAPPDGLPTAEPRVLRAVGRLCGLAAPPTEEEFERIALAWRPFRMWVAVLAVRSLAAAGGFAADPGDRARRGRPRAR